MKAFDEVNINSTYFEGECWHCRTFDFALAGVTPEQNDEILKSKDAVQQTIVSLKKFKNPYRDAVAYSLESLAKKLIEHCLYYRKVSSDYFTG